MGSAPTPATSRPDVRAGTVAALPSRRARLLQASRRGERGAPRSTRSIGTRPHNFLYKNRAGPPRRGHQTTARSAARREIDSKNVRHVAGGVRRAASASSCAPQPVGARESYARRQGTRSDRARNAPPMTIACRSCGRENRAANRFCEECGAALARRCDRCGEDLPPTAKFCGACGALAESVPGRTGPIRRATEGLEARKVVTIVFADLIGSTALHERLDAESVQSLMG